LGKGELGDAAAPIHWIESVYIGYRRHSRAGHLLIILTMIWVDVAPYCGLMHNVWLPLWPFHLAKHAPLAREVRYFPLYFLCFSIYFQFTEHLIDFLSFLSRIPKSILFYFRITAMPPKSPPNVPNNPDDPNKTSGCTWCKIVQGGNFVQPRTSESTMRAAGLEGRCIANRSHGNNVLNERTFILRIWKFVTRRNQRALPILHISPGVLQNAAFRRH